MPKRQKSSNGGPDLFDLSLAHATQSALVGWYAQYIHDMIESDPEFRDRMNEHAAFVFERLAKGFRERMGKPRS